MNSEIIARLQSEPIIERLDRLERELLELKALIREILSAVSK